MADVAKPLDVVVIGRNEGERLSLCLHSVLDATASTTQSVVYVDSASTDGSAQRAVAMDVPVMRLERGRMTAARGRNAGWKLGTAPFVLFVDGDCLLDPGFVESALPHFADPTVAVVWGVLEEERQHHSIYHRAVALDWVYPEGDSEFCGGNCIVRRSVLERTGGFDDAIAAGEEPELCARIRALGYRIRHIDVPMVRHDSRLTSCRQYWTRAVRCGEAYAEVSAKLSRAGIRFWQQRTRRNYWQGALYAALALAALAFSLMWRSPIPLALALTAWLALALRTSHRARWKSSDPITRFLYGLHSHFVYLPLLLGQLRSDLRGMRHHFKQLLTYALRPAAALWAAATPLRRIWWRAQLARRIDGPLPATAILLGEVEVHGTGHIEIGPNAFFYPGVYLETQGEGRIRIGANVVLSRGVHIAAFHSVDVDDGVMIGEYSSVRDANHHRNAGHSLRQATHIAAPIHIGTDAWIGRGCAVLAGVSVGAFATVGANSTVTRNVAAGETHAGSPARRIHTKTEEAVHVL